LVRLSHTKVCDSSGYNISANIHTYFRRSKSFLTFNIILVC
jgi:hypothetical protein